MEGHRWLWKGALGTSCCDSLHCSSRRGPGALCSLHFLLTASATPASTDRDPPSAGPRPILFPPTGTFITTRDSFRSKSRKPSSIRFRGNENPGARQGFPVTPWLFHLHPGSHTLSSRPPLSSLRRDFFFFFELASFLGRSHPLSGRWSQETPNLPHGGLSHFFADS